MPKFDQELLFLYSEQARRKIRDMALLLRKSPQRLKYSLAMLEKEKVLHNVHSIIDYSYFGLVLFKVYFKGGYISEKDKADILQKLSENPYVVSMYELSGEFDLAIELESPNPSRFNKELKKIANLHPTLSHYKVILNVVTHLYPRIYLIKDTSLIRDLPQEIIVGGDREVQDFSAGELAVIKNLLYHPQARLSTLAKQANLHTKTVKSLLKSLEQKKVIKGCKYIINTDKLDIHKSRLFLTLHNLSKEREAKLMEFLLNTKEIVQLNKTVGDWDLEVDLETLEKSRMRQLTIQLREEFKDLIETFNSMEFYEYFKKSYLPRYLFEQNTETKAL